jgi:hypothetical protein
LNLDQLVWDYVKHTGTAKSPPISGESLADRIEADLQAVQDNPYSSGTSSKRHV